MPVSSGLAWRYLRLSGILVIALVLAHLFVMHYANVPSATGTAFVAKRWATAFWREFDWVLLFLALSHGLVGMSNVFTDIAASRIARRAIGSALLIVAAAFLAIGSASIVRAANGPSARGLLSSATWIVGTLDALLGALAIAIYLTIAAIVLTVVIRLAYKLPLEWWQFHGQWAWALHRLTGIGVLLFLLVHVLDLALVPLAPDLYDATIASYANPLLIPMEVALVCAVIYHALNGVRLIVLEHLERSTTAGAVVTFAGVLVATVLLVLPSVVVLVRHS